MKDDKISQSGISLPILLAFYLAIGILAGYWSYKSEIPPSENVNRNSKKLKEVINLIDKEYVDEVDMDFLTESAIDAILAKLDPHSTYINAENKELSEVSFESDFEGIGIEFNIIDDTLMVISPLSGGPSEKLGISPGDRIIEIDGENVTNIGLSNKDVFEKLRGPKGSIVRMKVLNKTSNEFLQYEIVRDRISSESVEVAYMIDKHTGFIKIGKFTENTAFEFRTSLQALKEDGLENLILDLRNNSGGILSSALMISDEFLPDGEMILYTQGKGEKSNFEYKSRLPGLFETGNLIVLINEGSASASEIVAGALQDYDRATIIGRRSFGKGLVQSSFDMKDGSELRMTISRYFIPSGRSIQKPYENGRDEYRNDIANRFEKGEFFHLDSIQNDDSLVYKTKSGRVVFGGGGITPDIFIASDTSLYSSYLSQLNSQGILYDFCFSYANENRQQLESMNLKKYIEDFKVSPEMLARLKTKALEKDIPFSNSDFEKSKLLILTQIKALIARHLWRDNGFYMVYNSIDPVYLTAVSQFN